MQINTLLFDIGDVLIDIDLHRGYRKMLGHMSHDNGQLFILEEIIEALSPYGDDWDNLYMGKIEAEDFLSALIKKTNSQNKLELLKEAITDLFEPLPERIALLNKLATNPDFTVALVSDTNIIHITNVENYITELYKNIPRERRFYSHNVGKMKKLGGEFYQHVLDVLDVKAENALMIDDREKNKPGADAVGLNFLLIQKDEDLVAALQADPYRLVF